MKKVILVLQVILIGLACFLIYLFTSLNQTIQTISGELSTAIEQQAASTQSTEAENAGLLNMYALLYENLAAYNLIDQYEQDSVDLANVILERTVRTLTIQDIEYERDGFLITAAGEGVPVTAIDEELLSRAIWAAARKYLTSHFLDMTSALLQGNSDELKEMLFSQYGSEFFQALEEEILKLPAQEYEQVFHIYANDQGQMIVEEVTS